MAIFTIGDLHLSLGTSKPMDIFSGWENYVERLRENRLWVRRIPWYWRGTPPGR